MPHAASVSEAAPAEADSSSGYGDLRRMVEHAAHLLPAQGPIEVFVHHNTLHAFEDQDFATAVVRGSRVYGAEPYLSEHAYRELVTVGRIRHQDLDAVLLKQLGNRADGLIAALGTRFALRSAMLRCPIRDGVEAELRWEIAESDALDEFRRGVDPRVRERMVAETRDWSLGQLQRGAASTTRPGGATGGDPRLPAELRAQLDSQRWDTWSERRWEAFVLRFLWQVCYEVSQSHGAPVGRGDEGTSDRHRDLLLAVCEVDSDELAHDVLTRFTAAFLDQGVAGWELPHRAQGLYRSFLQGYALRGVSPTRWASQLRRLAAGQLAAGVSPAESLEESLAELGVAPGDAEGYLAQTLLALPGWAGMIWQLETRAGWSPHPVPPGTLLEYLAVRLLVERVALAKVARDALGFAGPLAELRSFCRRRLIAPDRDTALQRAYLVFQLAQFRGWNPHHLLQLDGGGWRMLFTEVDEFDALERRRIYHLGYERRYRNQTLDAVLAHARRAGQQLRKAGGERRPAYQLLCCIDDREESFRRHLEEIDPDCETFGIAGFFGVAMYYRGVTDAHFRPLCPISIEPSHYVTEEPSYSLVQLAKHQERARRRLGRVTRQAHLGSRSFFGGIFTGLLGSVAAFPLVARILFPRLTAQLTRLLSRMVVPASTDLRIERIEGPPAREDNPDHETAGYTVEEMAAIVEGALRALGLSDPRRLAPLLLVCGHGSASVNNPHESAYNCGACSGGRGGPNARAFSMMANDHRVRRVLEQRGLAIPADTHFVGGYHNTCSDAVTWFDLNSLPVSHRRRFEAAEAAINQARQRNARERCRRFETVSLDISAEEALTHVENRAEDLSQPRPEYNHATVALCLVGRRAWSRGLFLDRRAFLTSYDPAQDDARGTILEGLLRAVIPVCAGISLEYYFSTVDNEVYGCGNKLPHNLTALLGVMTGAQSDLRTGLAAQMVEIHEPLRLLFIIETNPQVLQRIIDENPAIARLVIGQWVQVAVFDPESCRMLRFTSDGFGSYQPESCELPVVASSADWYQGKRSHLGFATVDTGERR